MSTEPKAFTDLGDAAQYALETEATVFVSRYKNREIYAVADSEGEAVGVMYEAMGIQVGVVASGAVLKAYNEKQNSSPEAENDLPAIPEAVSKKKKGKAADAEAASE